jgi:hypothetical protein
MIPLALSDYGCLRGYDVVSAVSNWFCLCKWPIPANTGPKNLFVGSISYKPLNLLTFLSTLATPALGNLPAIS